ncbi:MAG: DNA polymerase subunit beta [Bacteroidetes bacterium 4484_249]|nr:MAG: DNA polymerase subunit beta [Bacteroidetes bacterium 4484_249]
MLTKNKILQVLKEKKEIFAKYGVDRIGLFGSYSKGKQNHNSDIDILIDFNSEQETFDNLMKIYDILESAFENCKIEIVTKNGLSKYIGSYILNETEYA